MRSSFNSLAFKEFNRKERFDPDIYRAVWVTVALIVPLIIASYIDKPFLGILPAITAKLMISAKIRGTFAEKTIILLLGTLALSLAAFIGTLSGDYLISAVVFIGLVAGVASLARGIKDYGQVFGITAVILFLISLHPPNTFESALQNGFLVILGGVWAIILSIYRWPFRPNEPFYLDIATPWYISTELMKSLTEPSFDKKKSEAYISQKENDLRKAINNTLPWLKKRRKETAAFRREALKTVRASSRFGAAALTLHNELSNLKTDEVPLPILLRIKKAAQIIGDAGESITNALASKRKSDYLKAQSKVQKASPELNILIKSIEDEKTDTEIWITLLRIVSLFESAVHYLEDALSLIYRMKNTKIDKTFKNTVDLAFRFRRLYTAIFLQLQPNSLLLQHSIRVMIMTSLGLFIYYFFEIPKGYWIVLTVMVLLQPEFTATWEKSRDRILGTLLGVILGSLLLFSSLSFHFSFWITVVAISSFLYVYYQNKIYKVAVVFVTIMLVAMLDLSEHIEWQVAAFRLLSTVIGAILSVVAAYTFWPDWESLHFPLRISKGIKSNKNFLEQIGVELQLKTGFHPRLIAVRRKAEIENLNLEDSLKRLKHEPSRYTRRIKNAQVLADLNKKLTRELTAFASYLPQVKENIDFQEAQELITHCTSHLGRIASIIETKRIIDLNSEFIFPLEALEVKVKSMNEAGQNYPKSNTLIMEASLLPTVIVSSEILRIITLIKEIVEGVKEVHKVYREQ